MSKNIVIQEGGIGKQLTADKLKTNLVGGGTCLWVPVDETQLGTKYVSENGTYKASDDGFYGYSEFTVSGVGTATGKDSDGDNAQTTTDPTTGDLVTEKIVESIGITAGPTTTTYQDGATLDFSGLVVHGYSSTGRDLGVIPLNKLDIQPTIAHYDPSSADSTASSDLIDGSLSIGGGIAIHREAGENIYDDQYSGCTFAAWADGSSTKAVAAAETDARITATHRHLNTRTGDTDEYSTTKGLDQQYTHNGKTVYYTLMTLIGTNPSTVVSPALNPTPHASNAAIAWTIVYGNIQAMHSTQTITVSYTNSTGNTLTTTFTVSVTESMGGATGGGGQAGVLAQDGMIKGR